jgi:transcriptional regulator with XRE-family HTH domain
VDVRKEIGRRIRAAREERKLSQSGLAALLPGDVTQSAVSFWEAGRNAPTAENLRDLCVALGKSADWMLGLESEAPRGKADRLAARVAELPAEPRRVIESLLPYLAPSRRKR